MGIPEEHTWLDFLFCLQNKQQLGSKVKDLAGEKKTQVGIFIA